MPGNSGLGLPATSRGARPPRRRASGPHRTAASHDRLRSGSRPRSPPAESVARLRSNAVRGPADPVRVVPGVVGQPGRPLVVMSCARRVDLDLAIRELLRVRLATATLDHHDLGPPGPLPGRGRPQKPEPTIATSATGGWLIPTAALRAGGRGSMPGPGRDRPLLGRALDHGRDEPPDRELTQGTWDELAARGGRGDDKRELPHTQPAAAGVLPRALKQEARQVGGYPEHVGHVALARAPGRKRPYASPAQPIASASTPPSTGRPSFRSCCAGAGTRASVAHPPIAAQASPLDPPVSCRAWRPAW